jgi:hypothetical protein
LHLVSGPPDPYYTSQACSFSSQTQMLCPAQVARTIHIRESVTVSKSDVQAPNSKWENWTSIIKLKTTIQTSETRHCYTQRQTNQFELEVEMLLCFLKKQTYQLPILLPTLLLRSLRFVARKKSAEKGRQPVLALCHEAFCKPLSISLSLGSSSSWNSCDILTCKI